MSKTEPERRVITFPLRIDGNDVTSKTSEEIESLLDEEARQGWHVSASIKSQLSVTYVLIRGESGNLHDQAES